MNNTIEILNTLFLVCAILTGVFFALSVILFFIFDIRTIFNIRTGRAKKKTVQEMQDANSRTDVLKASKTDQRTRRGNLTGPLGAAPTSKKLRHSAEIIPPPQPQKVASQPNALPLPETELLTPETSALGSSPEAPETAVLTQNDTDKRNVNSNNYNFTVTKRVMLICTEEIVP